MKRQPAATPTRHRPGKIPTNFEAFARRAVLQRLAGLRFGRLRILDGDRSIDLGEVSGTHDLDVTLEIRDPGAWVALAFRGSVGAGEAYVRGAWASDDLAALMRLITRNRDLLDRLEQGLARLAGPALRAFEWLHRNTRSGSRANIAAHYDLGNDFFELFLDESMTYSCGIFSSPETTLHEASIAKIDRLCRKLDLRPGDRLLEIGTGWGSFAIHAARHYGCQVTTTTISRQQFALATERIQGQGLADRVTVLHEDYRDLRGRFDKLVSIEMIEAIGHDQLPTFFAACTRLLADDGVLALQAITIPDQAYERSRRSIDFIKRHIFPGSCIPSVTALCAAATGASDLRLVHMESLTPHYARTLRAWRDNLYSGWTAARDRGYTEELLRKWEYYLALCEGGFAEHYLGDVQMLLERPGSRRTPLLGALSPTANEGGSSGVPL